ncbi:MAG: hypothetical protein VB878_16585, partial [Pirellulaceae bacterium]
SFVMSFSQFWRMRTRTKYIGDDLDGEIDRPVLQSFCLIRASLATNVLTPPLPWQMRIDK